MSAGLSGKDRLFYGQGLDGDGGDDTDDEGD